MNGSINGAVGRNLTVGARGWDHAAWTGTFYPEDLPPDWRLDYYCNEFNALLGTLPEVSALGSGYPLADDLSDDFRVAVELPAMGAEMAATEKLQGLLESLRPLERRLEALLLSVDGPGGVDRLQTCLQLSPAWPCYAPLYALARQPPTGRLRDALQHYATPVCWVGDSSWGLEPAPVGLMGFARHRPDLRTVRKQIEAFARECSAPELLLFIEGDPPDPPPVGAIREIQILAELLGF